MIFEDLQSREKLGSGVPLAAWLREGWADLIKENLLF